MREWWRKRLGPITDDKVADRLKKAEQRTAKLERKEVDRKARLDLLLLKSRIPHDTNT